MKFNMEVKSMLLFFICVVFEMAAFVVCSEFFASNGLHQTIVIDLHNKRKQSEMEHEILTLLGLHQRPQVIKHGYEYSAPKFMITLYNSLLNEEGESITDEIEFNSKVNLTLGKPMEHINGTDVIRSFINHGWVNFNVTRALTLWSYIPSTNLGLYMKVTVLDGENRQIAPGKFGIVGRNGPDDQQAFLVGFFKMARSDIPTRTRRSADGSNNETPDESDKYYYWGGNTMDNYRKSACQRHTLYDWIIAPDGYPAFFCGGECTFPLGAQMNATNHAIVQTLVHLTRPFAVPKPCCAPTKLSPIQVLYFDDKSNVVLRKYGNMKVKACGCH
ncbi:BMP7-like protein [Mya arenaria]|uniref:BMP7-like protein n=1 Tax=Mya arenaria TaxID=6604 RepID=A0ABY7F5Q5_MYAAR|nr:BMP7-like protein [Mya arenaria]